MGRQVSFQQQVNRNEPESRAPQSRGNNPAKSDCRNWGIHTGTDEADEKVWVRERERGGGGGGHAHKHRQHGETKGRQGELTAVMANNDS